MSMLTPLQSMILSGSSFEDACATFPGLSISTWRRAGGLCSAKPVSRSGGRSVARQEKLVIEMSDQAGDTSLQDRLFLSARTFPIERPAPEVVAYRSLFGDAHLEMAGKSSCYLLETHAFSQSPYLWAKAALLGPNLARITIDSSVGSCARDARITIRSITCEGMRSMHSLFYGNGKKDVMSEKLYESFDITALSWWIMDDGSRDKNSVDWTVAKQPHYTTERAKAVCSMVTSATGVRVSLYEDARAYLFKVHEDDIPLLLPYVHPNMAYKFTEDLNACGGLWDPAMLSETRRLLSCHGLESHPYAEGKSIISLPRELAVTAAVSMARVLGFPYPPPLSLPPKRGASKAEEFQCSDGDTAVLASNRASACLSGFFPGRYSVRTNKRPSPVDVFRGKKILGAAMKAQIASGDGLSLTSIRSAICHYAGRVAAHFNPIVAEHLIRKYSPVASPAILDPCGGWGGRLLGAHYAGASRYRCFEPEPGTLKGLKDLASLLSPVSSTTMEVEGAVAQDPSNYKECSADMVLTCPPYHDYEVYSRNPLQSSHMFPSYSTWLEGFLRPLVEGSYKSLKSGGVLVIVVGDVLEKNDLVADTRSMCSSLLTPVDEMWYCVTGKRTSSFKDRVLVFKKRALYDQV